MRWLGIDEAGRGCVLGPLCVAGFLYESADDGPLRAIGVDDSKLLSPARRTEVRAQLDQYGRFAVHRISAREIDGANLNRLEEAAIVRLVARFEPDVVLVDALGPPRGIPRVIERLQAALPDGLAPKWVMEPKADHTYAVVGAASIVAKTTRDGDLEALKAEHGELGSGYPHDPHTRRWLEARARARRPWPAFVRTRWGTIRQLAQSELFETS